MSQLTASTANILIAADNNADAAVIKKLLEGEFENVHVSTLSAQAVSDFDQRSPNILILAFNSLEKAEVYYLGLYRLSTKVHDVPHRTIVLCNKENANSVYALCKKQYFDDYVLFWPMNHDATRLQMAIHHAVRELASLRAGEPTAAEFATQVRRIAQLESMLEAQMRQGKEQIDVANQAVEQAGQDIGEALEDFSRRLVGGELANLVDVKNARGLAQEFDRFNQEEVGKRLGAAAKAVKPLQQWSDNLRHECTPFIESSRELAAMAEKIRPTIMVVDDDEFQRKTVGRILEFENYRCEFATNGVEALGILRRFRPDLIIMDVMMPNVDGIEVTKRLKAVPQFASVPIIMVSGKSEGSVVMNSLKAGAANFLVKPFERDTLLAKVSRALRNEGGLQR